MTSCLACGEPIDMVGALQVHPTCEADPDVAVGDVFTTVRDAILNQPRSLQSRIGPSEVGHPCARRLGHKLAGTPEVNARGVAWKPFIGTAVHEQMAQIFGDVEVARWKDPATEHPRWYVEERVSTGQVNGTDVDGNADLIDAAYGIVYDWKFTTRNQINRVYSVAGPGRQYEAQAHLYARGWAARGFAVRHVAIIFLTRDGEFSDRYVWHAPYDEQIAIDALARLDNIDATIRVLGADAALPMLPATANYCGHCPWHRTGETDLTRACPGVDKDGNDQTDLMSLVFPGGEAAPHSPEPKRRRSAPPISAPAQK